MNTENEPINEIGKGHCFWAVFNMFYKLRDIIYLTSCRIFKIWRKEYRTKYIKNKNMKRFKQKEIQSRDVSSLFALMKRCRFQPFERACIMPHFSPASSTDKEVETCFIWERISYVVNFFTGNDKL